MSNKMNFNILKKLLLKVYIINNLNKNRIINKEEITKNIILYIIKIDKLFFI